MINKNLLSFNLSFFLLLNIVPNISLSVQIPNKWFEYQKRNILLDAGVGWESITNFSPASFNSYRGSESQKDFRKKTSFEKNIFIQTNNFDVINSFISLRYKTHFFCHLSPSLNITNKINPAPTLNPFFSKGNWDYSGFGYENNWAILFLGTGNENWGSGNNIQLALSDKSRSYDYFLLGSDYGRVRVRYIHGFLENIDDNINRFINARGIEWTNKNSLLIGISEITIYSGENRSLDFGYLNPISSHLEIEYNNRLNIYGNRNSNAVWQLHLDILLKNRLRISCNYLYDEFVLDPDIEIGKEHGKAYSARISYTAIASSNRLLTIYGKLIKVGTPTFRHGNGFNNFVSDNKPLGWYKGSDGRDLSLGINFYNRKNFLISILSGYNESGIESIIYRNYEPYEDYQVGPFPSGEIKETLYLECYLGYLINSNIHVMGGIERVKMKKHYDLNFNIRVQLSY